MKIRLVNDEQQILEYDILEYKKYTTKEEISIEYYSNLVIKFKFKLEEKKNISFIRKFLFESDEVHADILFDSNKIYRLYNPNFNFNLNNIKNGLKNYYDFEISIITTLQ